MSATVGDLLTELDVDTWQLNQAAHPITGQQWAEFARYAAAALEDGRGRISPVRELHAELSRADQVADLASGTPDPAFQRITERMGAVADLLQGVDRTSHAARLDNARLGQHIAGIVHLAATGVQPAGEPTRAWAMHLGRVQAVAEATVRHPRIPDPGTAPHLPNRYDDLRATPAHGLDAAISQWRDATRAALSGSIHDIATAYPVAMADLALLSMCAARAQHAADQHGIVTGTTTGVDQLRQAAGTWRDAQTRWNPSWWVGGDFTRQTPPQTDAGRLLRLHLHDTFRTGGQWANPTEIAARHDLAELASSTRHATRLAADTGTQLATNLASLIDNQQVRSLQVERRTVDRHTPTERVITARRLVAPDADQLGTLTDVRTLTTTAAATTQQAADTLANTARTTQLTDRLRALALHREPTTPRPTETPMPVDTPTHDLTNNLDRDL